jgi:hypothetical protein
MARPNVNRRARTDRIGSEIFIYEPEIRAGTKNVNDKKTSSSIPGN